MATISLARWKVLQLIELAQTAAACDSLQLQQDLEIQAATRLQAVTDSLLSLTTYQLVLAKADRNMADQQLENQKELTTLEKRKKRKWVGLFLGAVVLFVAVEVVSP